MFKDTYPHLFNVGSTKDSCGDNTPRILSGAKAPRPYGTPLDKNHRSKAVEIVRRFRSTVLYLAPAVVCPKWQDLQTETQYLPR